MPTPPTADATRRRPLALGLTGRVFLGTAAIVAVVISAAFVISSASVRRAAEASSRVGLEQSADLVAQLLAGRGRSLGGGARVFVQGPYFRTLVAERRRDDLLDQAFEASEQLDADWVFLTDDRGMLLAKSDEPGASGTAMGGVPLIAGALRGLTTTGFGVSRDSLLFQAVAVPIMAPAGAPIGVLVATRVVDSLLLHDVKATTSSELLFYVRDERGAQRIVASTLGRNEELGRVVSRVTAQSTPTAARRPDVRIAGTQYLAQGSALTTAGGDVIGGFVLLRSRAAESTGIAAVRRSLAIAGLIGLLLSLLAAYIAARRVAAPVRELAGIMRRASDGEYLADVERTLGALDSGGEMRDLGMAFGTLLNDLRDKEALGRLSPGTRLGPASAPESAASIGRQQSRHVIGAATPRNLALTRPGLMLEPGAILANRYRIERMVGSGGLGIVYCAQDRMIGETVAVKVLRPEILAGDAGAITQFADELRVARRVSHRNVVRMHDIGESDGLTFLTMEYVDGASLATVIESRGALPQPAVVSIAKQLLRALAVMHAEGVVHGDLKPANLLLGPNGVLKVTDFGIARVVRRSPRESSSAAEHVRASVGHLAGAVVGTPEYMAPEQLIGSPASRASDIYAAGTVLHECLRGVTPFGADTRVTFIAHKLDLTPASVPRISAAPDATRSAVESLIAHMMNPSVDARPHSAADLFDRLNALS